VATPRAEPVIEVREVSTRFGNNLVHDRISLTVDRGEIFAIVGGSGSGKSTLLREMVMLQRPTSGKIRVLGRELAALSEEEGLRLRRRIGVLFQNGALFGAQSVLRNVGFPLREHTRLGNGLIDEICRLKLALAGLAPEAAALFPSQLSGGMRKRAALARAIALDPEILFLDEPTSGLDPLSADAFDELVLSLKAALQPTIVLVTHDMDSLWRVADRVALLGRGPLLGVGPMAELMASPDPAVLEFFNSPRGRAAMQAHR
jgi:phospholipid/cholesterol/gamma-HCH transport system ATP-binding protein